MQPQPGGGTPSPVGLQRDRAGSPSPGDAPKPDDTRVPASGRRDRGPSPGRGQGRRDLAAPLPRGPGRAGERAGGFREPPPPAPAPRAPPAEHGPPSAPSRLGGPTEPAPEGGRDPGPSPGAYPARGAAPATGARPESSDHFRFCPRVTRSADAPARKLPHRTPPHPRPAALPAPGAAPSPHPRPSAAAARSLRSTPAPGAPRARTSAGRPGRAVCKRGQARGGGEQAGQQRSRERGSGRCAPRLWSGFTAHRPVRTEGLRLEDREGYGHGEAFLKDSIQSRSEGPVYPPRWGGSY